MSRLFPVAVPAFQIRPAGSRSDPSPGVLRDLSHINPALPGIVSPSTSQGRYNHA